jgi:hypothetical protein
VVGRKNELRGDVRSAGGERRSGGGGRSGVVVDSSYCGKAVHDGKVLRAVTGSSEGAEAVLHGSSMAVVEISGTEGATGGGRRKEAPRWGLGVLSSRQRRWTSSRKRWAVRR